MGLKERGRNFNGKEKNKSVRFIFTLLISFGCKEVLEKKKNYREKVLNETLKEARKNISGALYSEKVEVIKDYLKIYGR